MEEGVKELVFRRYVNQRIISLRVPAQSPAKVSASQIPKALRPYHIVVPIFNEGDKLDGILKRIRSLGYLDKITFVNDASQDNSKFILQEWEKSEGIEVLHLSKNMKKEGAILFALEKLSSENRLPEHVILLDSDSYLVSNTEGQSLEGMIDQAIAYMGRNHISGMPFRMDPIVPSSSAILQRAQYAEYVGTRFWNRISAMQGKLWVINGPGGIFRSEVLLKTLRNIVHDFETGDLLITVNMMKENHRIGYYPGIKVQTTVPSTFQGLFKQRRRWARGTLKVIFDEHQFYLKQIPAFNILALQAGILLATNFLITFSLITNPLGFFMARGLCFGYLLGVSVNCLIALLEKGVRKEGEALKVVGWAFLQGLVYVVIITPANIMAIVDVLKYLVFEKVPGFFRKHFVSYAPVQALRRMFF